MLKWLLSISFENGNLCTVTVLLRGGWYMWNVKRPLSISRWRDDGNADY